MPPPRRSRAERGRTLLSIELSLGEQESLRRSVVASRRLGLRGVSQRYMVLLGMRYHLERLRGECVRRGIDFEQLMRESSDPESVERIDAPPARLDGFADDPGS